MNKYQNFYIDTTLEQLDQQFKNVNEQLEEIYKKYSKQHDILIQELSKIMMEYKITGEVMDIDKLNQAKINKEMRTEIEKMVNSERVGETESINNILNDAVKNTYKYQEYILGLGLDFTSLPLSEKVISKIVNNKIAGTRWIERIGVNKKDLEIQMKKDIDDFVKGKLSVNKIGKNIRDNFNMSKYNSNRLARTELCRVQQEILNQFDKDHDVEWQLFMGTLDNLTSPTCREKDGQQYKITDNSRPIPPLHPHCRSAMVGIPHKDYKPTTRRDNETGDIIDYTDYNSWAGGEKIKEKINKTPKNVKGQEIKFDIGKLKEERQKLVIDTITELSNKYDTNLISVSNLGGDGKGVKGSVRMDFSMNLSSPTLSTIVHEFGHTLTMTKADKLGLGNDLSLNKEFWKEIKRVRTQYTKAINNDWTKRISIYSTESIDEFMCEAFAHSYIKDSSKLGIEYGSDFEFSDKVMAIVDKYYKK